MPDITLSNLDRTIRAEDQQTILSAALDAGIAYPHGCKSGRCGTCKSHLSSGQVGHLDHSRFALIAEERQAGLILACRAVPVTDATVRWLGEARAPMRRQAADLAVK